MRYHVKEGTEVNCNVTLDVDGTVRVEPIISDNPYGFLYRECEDEGGECQDIVWDSRDHDKDPLKVITQIEISDLRDKGLLQFLSDIGVNEGELVTSTMEDLEELVESLEEGLVEFFDGDSLTDDFIFYSDEGGGDEVEEADKFDSNI